LKFAEAIIRTRLIRKIIIKPSMIMARKKLIGRDIKTNYKPGLELTKS